MTGISRRGKWMLAGAGAAAVILAGWLFFPQFQTVRANSDLAVANASIGQANRLVASIDTDALKTAGFSSVNEIHQEQSLLDQYSRRLNWAGSEIRQADAEASSAAGLARLPGGYRNYLQAKAAVARLRLKQLGNLQEAVAKLKRLYGSGNVIFQSLNDMDRLLGQLQTAISELQANPDAARTSLENVSKSMRIIQQQLDQRRAQTGFDLLTDMSQEVSGDADVADLASRVAAAVATGSQSQAEASAQALVTRLLGLKATTDDVDRWMILNIDPLLNGYDQMQTEAKQLDSQAKALH